MLPLLLLRGGLGRRLLAGGGPARSLPLAALTAVHRPQQQQLQQRRPIIHVPILGAMGAKALGLLAVKKAVVIALIQRYGVHGTFEIMRGINNDVSKKMGVPEAVRNTVKVSLDALESGVQKIEPAEQAEVVWKWVKAFDPQLLTEVVRRYATAPASPISTTTDPSSTQVNEEKEAQLLAARAEETELQRKIAQLVPEIADKYHVVLVNKELLGKEQNFRA